MEGLPNEHKQLYTLLLRAINTQTEEIKQEIQQKTLKLENDLKEANQEIQVLQKRVLEQERINRKNNIVVFGINFQNAQNLLEETIKTLNEVLKCDINKEDINNYYSLGQSEGAPVILEFISYIKKKSLFQNSENLKKLKERNLGIANDLGPEDRKDLKVLQYHLREARSQQLNAKIKGLKLYIDGRSFTANQLQEIEQNRSSESEAEELTSDEEVNTQETGKTKQKEPISQKEKPLVEVQSGPSLPQTKRKRRRISYSPKVIVTRSNNKQKLNN